MKRCIRFVIAISFAFATAQVARAQVVSLLVGNQSGFSGLDRYDATTGAFLGNFAVRPGNGSFSYFKYGGPSNNLFVHQGVAPFGVLQFDGHTGNFINNYITQTGGRFCFGPDGNCYRLEPFSQTQQFPRHIGKYDGVTGVRIGTFVEGAVSGLGDQTAGSMRFGPDGNLYVDSGNTIFRFNGSTGTPMGAFIPPASGGLLNAQDAIFASNGDLIVTGIKGTPNDTTWRFDGSNGAYLGFFASGNGIDTPAGVAQGGDGRIYIASAFSSEIKRFDLLTGSFVDNFIPATTHMFPGYIGFTPIPVPEPTSLSFLSVTLGAAALLRVRRWLSRDQLGCSQDPPEKKL